MSDCENWMERAARCPLAAEGFEPYHKWIVASKNCTGKVEQASMLVCGVCFHEVNLGEIFTHRKCFKAKHEKMAKVCD